MGGDNGTSNTEYIQGPWDDFIDISTNPSQADPDEIELVNKRVDQHEKEIEELKEEIYRLRQERYQASPPPSLARLFSTQKEKINSDSEKIKNSNEQHHTIPPKNLTEFPFPEATDRAKINNNLNGVSLETADLSAVVLENMASGRFSTKVIDIPSGTYAETSVAGSDVLLSTYTDRDTSYSRKTKYSAYLLDAITGEQKQIDQFCTLITPSYLFDVGDGNLKIWRRSDYSLMTVSLPVDLPDYARWTSNSRSGWETMLIGGDNPLLIDLHTGVHMHIYKVKGGFDMQMYGALIAYKVDYVDPILRIYDYKSREDLFKRKISQHTEYYLMDNKIALVEFNGNNMNWTIMDFQENIIKEGSFTSSASTHFRSVSVFKNFLIINQGPRMHFVDINSGKKLISLKAHGYGSYNHVVGFDYGKFICTTEYYVQIVNFETPDPATNQPVKVVVLNTNGTTTFALPKTGTVSDMVNGLRYQYNDARDFLEFQSHDGQIPETVMVQLNEKERINYVYFPGVVNKAGSEDEILARIYKASSKNKPEYNFNLTSVSDSTVKFFGRNLLYKEELVNGYWKPVDLGIKQAEEFIKSL